MLEGINRKYDISSIVASLVVLVFSGLLMYLLYTQIPYGQDKMLVSKEYIKMGVNSTGATNLVTSVVLSFRGLDTLGEVTVLFASAMAVGLFLVPGAGMWRREENFVLRVASRWLPYLIALIGIYIVSQGHVSPGGGFQGGVVIASGILLKLILKRERKSGFGALVHTLECLMGAGFVALGLVGLVRYGSFLYSFGPKGVPGALLSAGILPVLYTLIGVKVASEFVAILERFTSSGEGDERA